MTLQRRHAFELFFHLHIKYTRQIQQGLKVLIEKDSIDDYHQYHIIAELLYIHRDSSQVRLTLSVMSPYYLTLL